MKKIISLILVVITILSVLLALTGCQGAVRDLGGSMTLNLPKNTKLEMITWKEDSLWYLTRPMKENEEAEVHTFQQSSEFGIFEGTVTIIETKGE